MPEKLSSKEIVGKMYDNDAFSQWLGIEILDIDEGYCKIQMTVREEMLNGFKIAHGGISYSLADSAFAFASNSQGRHAVSIETSISHIRRIHSGDILTAVAREDSLGRRIAIYSIDVKNQDNQRVALFKGTVYRTSTDWE